VEGEPPEGEEAVAEPEPAAKNGVRPRPEEGAVMVGFFTISAYSHAHPPP
jgi:hypothetical protein